MYYSPNSALLYPNILAAPALQSLLLAPRLAYNQPQTLLGLSLNPFVPNLNPLLFTPNEQALSLNLINNPVLSNPLVDLQPLKPVIEQQHAKIPIIERDNPKTADLEPTSISEEPAINRSSPAEGPEVKKAEKEKKNNLAEPWTEEKIELLLVLAQKYKRDWKKIAKKLNDKRITPFQVKSKYCTLTSKNSLGLRVKFTLKEDLLLAKYFNIYKFDWEQIANNFKRRDSMMLKNRYYAYIRKRNLLEKLLNTVETLEKKYGKPLEEIEVSETAEL